jgi:hypothetical protein
LHDIGRCDIGLVRIEYSCAAADATYTAGRCGAWHSRGNVGNSFTALELGEVEAAARTLGLEVVALEIRGAWDIAPAFEALKSRFREFLLEAVYVGVSPKKSLVKIGEPSHTRTHEEICL